MYKKYIRFTIFLLAIAALYLVLNRVLTSTAQAKNHNNPLNPEPTLLAHVWSTDSPLLNQAMNTGEQFLYQNTYEKLSSNDKKEIEALNKMASEAEFKRKNQDSINANQAEAAWQLGLLHLHGMTQDASGSNAEKLFRLAWQGGEKKASLGLAWCSISGCGSAPNSQAKKRWLEEVKKFNFGRGIYLEWFSETLNAPITSSVITEPNTKKIDFDHHDILLEAEKKGDVQAQIELGIKAFQDNDLKASLAYFQSASKQSILADRNAKLVLEKIRSQKNLTNSLYRGKNDESLNQLIQAVKFHRGDGVPANYYLAIDFYKKAANLGNKNAKKMLALIFSKSPSPEIIDIAWMRQLSQIDVLSDKWEYDYSIGPKLVMRDITPISDYLPLKWQRLLYLD